MIVKSPKLKMDYVHRYDRKFDGALHVKYKFYDEPANPKKHRVTSVELHDVTDQVLLAVRTDEHDVWGIYRTNWAGDISSKNPDAYIKCDVKYIASTMIAIYRVGISFKYD